MRLPSTFARSAAVVALATLLAIPALPAAAASGDVTSTTLVAPAAVSGDDLALAFNDGTGGAYQIYRSGQTRRMIRLDATGAFDADFNGGTPVSIGVPESLATTGAIWLVGTTHAGTQRWWAATASQSPSNSAGITITSGDAAGTVTLTANLTGASIADVCDGFVPDSGGFTLQLVFPRRGGGVWLSIVCYHPIGQADGGADALVYIPLTDQAAIDPASAAVSGFARHGSSAECALFPRVVSDPTSAAPAPELWIIRTEHDFKVDGNCVTSVFDQTRRDGVAGDFVALAALAVAADGTVTRTQLATGPAVQPGSMRIDPGGRPVALALEILDNTKVSLFRLRADGSLDTSVGSGGFTPLDTGPLPDGAVRLNADLIGVVTTASRTYFAVVLSDFQKNSFACNSVDPLVFGFRMALASVGEGWAAGFGTGGIGDRVTTTLPENTGCQGRPSATGFTVNPLGQPQNITLGETSATLNVWGAITGVTGGGEGGTGQGGFTTDTGGAPSEGSSTIPGSVDTEAGGTGGNTGGTDGSTAGGGGADDSATTIASAVDAAAGLSGASGVVVRPDSVTSLTAVVLPGSGSSGGLELTGEGLVVTLRSASGASSTLGITVPAGGEMTVRICTGLTPGSTVEGWVYVPGPRLVGAVEVPADHAEGECVDLVLPFGTPLDGGAAIGSGTHTLQLRMTEAAGPAVVVTVATVGGPVPSGIPAGGGTFPVVPLLALVALASVLTAGGLIGRLGRAGV